MKTNKTALTLLFSFFSVLLIAQSTEYISMDNSLQNIVRQGDWDSLIVEGTNLNIEDVSFANGCYYVAYGFHKQGDQDRAMKYLNKAKQKDTSLLGNKLTELEQEINASSKIQDLESAAIEAEKKGSPLESAENWIDLWRSNATRLDAAANGLFILTEQKEYERALVVIDEIRPKAKGSFLTEINTLKNRIESTPEIIKLRKLESEFEMAESYFKKGDWEQAYDHYNTVGKLEGYSNYTSSQMNICVDELAWIYVKNANSISDYLNYLDEFPDGIHYKTCKNYCLEYYSNLSIAYAMECNLEKAEEAYKSMENRFFGNETTIYTKDRLCTIYEKCGDLYAKERNSTSQVNASIFYRKVYRDCTPNSALNTKLNTSEKLATRWGRIDKLELGYSFDEKDAKGFRLATSNTMRLGFHWAMRASKGILTTTTGYTVNKEGKIPNNIYNTSTFTGTKKNARFDATMGVTQRIAYPIYCYAGAGVGYYPEFYEMNVFDYQTGALTGTEWAYNEDTSLIKPIAEFGLVLDYSFVHAGIGLVYNGVDDLYKTFVVGFAFTN
ncbi:MAG: hypothetical protein RL204_504 [Bacteroidota bacterium]|jgi:tetratricopeptide (TPR) repeat protein